MSALRGKRLQPLLLTFIITCTVVQVKVNAQPGTLRLVNNYVVSTSSGQGRLEIYLKNKWGTICDNWFGSAEAILACNQLGFRNYKVFGRVGYLGYRPATYSTPIWMTNLRCSTSEHLTIYNCPWSRYTSSCSHSEDVALHCTSPYPIRPFSLRLVTMNEKTSPSLTAGRLEIYFSGKWGSICIDGFSRSDASDVCDALFHSARALSYGKAGASEVGFNSGPKSSPVWLENLDCSYSVARQLYLCTHDGLGNTDCNHSRDVAVSCLADGAVRLASSQSSYYASPGGSAGRLEIYHNGQWGTVCNHGFSQTDADVVCRQLGFVRADRSGSANNLGYKRGTGSIWLSNIGCKSTDIFLANCIHSGFGNVAGCTHYQDVALSCTQSMQDYSNDIDDHTISAGASVGIAVSHTHSISDYSISDYSNDIDDHTISAGASVGIAVSTFATISCCICIIVSIACAAKYGSSSRSFRSVPTTPRVITVGATPTTREVYYNCTESEVKCNYYTKKPQ